ncbi:hypothetical protein IKE87_01435 [Candidatus Saccharibacteria bacterium]|nr:hypothetical protein [Candidatus Saccharibacteria bacterium]
MKKILTKVMNVGVGALMFFMPMMSVNNAFAACSEEQLKNGCVSTAILGDGCSCDDGSGSSVKSILSLVVEIMTVGVGILSVIGISVVGIQYLTAGGDEAQTRKAKRRMFEIIIGIILYVVAFALMSWLIPDFKPFQ